jgi:hypothetical protein
MVAKINKAAGDVVASDALSDFLALPSGEAQLVFLGDLLQQAQAAFNSTNPPPPELINRIAVLPQAEGIVLQANFPLADNAPNVAVASAVLPIGVGGTKLAASPDDDVTDPILTELLALPNLEAQIIWMSGRIQSSESVYNTANPNNSQNAITMVPNYDLRAVGLSALFPLNSGGLAALVGALPY